MTTLEIMKKAKAVKSCLATLSTDDKNRALANMAQMLILHKEEILEASSADVERARGKISDVMLDRLALSEKRIEDMANGIREVIDLPDPVGNVISEVTRPNGIVIEKVSAPMGVIAIIYESRPNVTSDAAALALKSGNACILRCGKEAALSARAITKALREGIAAAGLPEDLVQIIEDTSRESAAELMNGVGYIDLLIPRGGAGLIRACTENAKVPCIQTGTGICHVYIDKDADVEKALNILENAKTSRPSVCNAAEVCLVDENIADKILPLIKKRLVDKRIADGKIPVELRLDSQAAKIIDGTAAGENDFDTEFLDYVIAIKTVSGVKEACEHIAAHSTGHSEAIISENPEAAEYFTRVIDSAAVYVNASTRFTDGGEFGLGCEIGISTQKLHARGPMGLCELNTYKYIIRGNGQVR
ncbi:MAG: glutamate-5-semialdehyde dehydrogenase [Ruminococcaceae bacterium]|nr:glutamate-5-semialdehyde dehydrogenase [Oscillospiraceae bacterium]